MKTIYRTLVLGVFLAAVAFVSPTFAQDVCTNFESAQAKYKTFLENRKGTLAQMEMALKVGKEYLDESKECTTLAEQIAWVKNHIETKLGPAIETEKERIAKEKRYERFNTALNGKKTADMFAAGEDILKYEPEFLDLILTLTTVGLDEAIERQNDTFNGKTIEYAKLAIKKIEGGLETPSFGLKNYEFDTKENALGWMVYTIGNIEYYRQKNKESGLNNLYKSTQFNAETKDKEFIYDLMGLYYEEKANALNAEILELIKLSEGRETFEIKSKFALSRGFIDRSIDAYARAYEVSNANLKKATKANEKADKKKFSDSMFETLKRLYKFRYETTEVPIADTELPTKVNSHIAKVVTSKFVGPTATVVPVDPPAPEEEALEKEAAAASGTTSTTDKPIMTPAPDTKPASSKAATNGASVKTEADKTNNKPKQD